MTNRTISSDFVGRIRNISLAPSAANALLPMFEALTNSIQSIEDRFGPENLSSGEISVEVFRSGDDLQVTGFLITDNGIGLTEENMKSFETSDSRYKIRKGGKGIGRFIWLKVFEGVRIESNAGESHLSFSFVLDDLDQIRDVNTKMPHAAQGTKIHLKRFRPEYKSVCPKKSETIQAKIISHFLPYFINTNAPKIILVDGDSIDLFEAFRDLIREDAERHVEVDYNGENLRFVCNFYLLPKHISDDEKGVNALFYGANGRSVSRRAIDGLLASML